MTACLLGRPGARLVLEFSSENLRRAFLTMFCDRIAESMGEQLNAGFDYAQVPRGWRWNGKDTPTVRVFRRRKLR